MNAGPDVERLISDWLIEEAPERAPDRILGAAARTIERTKQRRFGAAWREPMLITSTRLAVAAVVIVAVVAGAALFGRSTAGVVGAPSPSEARPSAMASTSPTANVTIQDYKRARDAICTPAITQVIALNEQDAKLHPADSPADLAASITVLEQTIAVGSATVDKLAALEPPSVVAADHAADVTHHRDSLAVLKEALAKLRAGKVAEATAIGDATTPLSGLEEAFESKYGLEGCP
jgi:hypothetical protein